VTGSARWLTPPAAMLLAVGVAGCTAEATTPPPTGAASPFAACAGLAVPPTGPSSPGKSPSAAAAPPSAAELPDLSLPCFTGGAPFRLTDLRGPAVLNVWGSWCGPCRTELPMVQHLADRAAGRLTVLGVDTRDSRDAAASFGTDHRITMPMLFDPDQKLLGKLGRSNVPLTVFVDAAGRAYVDPLPLDPDRLTETVRQHTGVTVTP
jgi:cytochrome c biogenesis protein CcmG/thiol:disulfide interchange protein DsbE